MIQKNRIKVLAMLPLGALLAFALSCENKKLPQLTEKETSVYTEEILAYYQNCLDSAAFYISQLDTSQALGKNQALWRESRKWYKLAEPILISYDLENYKTINGPNLLKIDAEDFTDIKRIKPKGYQVLEELLFAEDTLDKLTLFHNILFMNARLPFMRLNHMIVRQSDRHHLRMVREAIVNVATKGITGFDSPMLANSLQEATYNYQTISAILIGIYKDAYRDKALWNEWKEEIDATIETLQAGDFDRFDRYTFIKKHTNKQLELINKTADNWGISLNTNYALNPTSTNLFAKDFFNVDHFAQPHSPAITKERTALGKALFNDTNLSSSGMSCATCHLKEKAFTDGLDKALGNDGEKLVRNTPTLAYASYQRNFFWDGVSSALESQIMGVLSNTKEFHIDLEGLEEQVRTNKNYLAKFDSLYEGKIDHQNIRHAISTYIRSLAPFNSKFDRSMQSEDVELEQIEIDGFNLFMGKAACATCHFPPAFNGTVPPKYLETELENLGTPADASFTDLILDEDVGAFEPYKVEERRHFFKTPTVRNAAMTAPYMHNGVYGSLEQVMKFYNFGGGAGMGLDVPYQTLPPDSLNLNDYEVKAIISFMGALTDDDY